MPVYEYIAKSLQGETKKGIKPENILELGTSLGLGSMYLAKGNSKSQVYTIEGVEPLYTLAKQNIEMIGFKNIHTYHDLFSDGLPKLLEKVVKFDR